MRTIAAAALVALLALPSLALGSDATVNVAIQNSSFNPRFLQITAGDTVVWTNLDGPPAHHTVTDVAGSFDSGNLQGVGASFSHTFASPGLVVYRCQVHPTMLAAILILAA